MDEVTKTGGRTIIFVSHNMDAVSQLCTKTVLIEKGKIVTFGDTDKVISTYIHRGYRENAEAEIELPLTDDEVTLDEFEILQDGKPAVSILGEKPFEVSVRFQVTRQMESFRVGIYLKNKVGTVLSRSFIQDWAMELEKIEPGQYRSKLIIPERLLRAGTYGIELKIFAFGIRDYFIDRDFGKNITVLSPKGYNELRSKNGAKIGYFLIPNVWEIERKLESAQ